MKYTVASICFLIVGARMVFPEVKFDWPSFYLVLMGVVALYIPRSEILINEFAKRLRKIKHKDTEIELGEIKELEDKVQKIEPLSSGGQIVENLDELVEPYDIPDQKLGMLVQMIEIEKNLKEIANQNNILLGNSRKLSPVTVSRELVKSGILPPEASSVVSDLWPIRNRIVHGEEDKEDYAFLDKYIEIAKKINKLLINVKNKR